MKLGSMKRKGRNEHEGSKGILSCVVQIIGTFFALLIILFLLFLQVPTASAIPSYARQTGFPVQILPLYAAGTDPAWPRVQAERLYYGRETNGHFAGQGKQERAQYSGVLPAFRLIRYFLHFFEISTAGPQNGSFQFPQQASLFLAGAWATHVGSFVQVTYTSQGDHFTWDNSDIRYANATKLFKKDLAFGITLNNNPTVEDLWNSTPAWGFPWVSSDWAPTPTAGAIINGGLAQDVAGIGMYAMWDNHLYFAGTIYRSAHIGAPQPNTGVDNAGAPLGINIRGVAPYWRLAWQQNSKNNNLEVGTYGMHMKSTPGGITGLEDGYTDWAADFQYDRTIPQFRGDVLSIPRHVYPRKFIAPCNFHERRSGFRAASPQYRPGERGVSPRR